MFFFDTYFDEGGTDANSRVCGISGFGMFSEHWLPFSLEWGKILAVPRKIEYFHAVEANNFRYEFEGFTKAERDSKVIPLVDLLCRYRPLCLPQSVDKVAYHDMCAKYPDSQLPSDPYIFCLMNQFIECADIVDYCPLGTTVHIILENNPQMRKYADAAYEHALRNRPRFKARLAAALSFRDKKKIKPLQSADLITYEMNKNFAARIADPHSHVRPALKRIEAMCTWRGIWWHGEKLERVFKGMEVSVHKKWEADER